MLQPVAIILRVVEANRACTVSCSPQTVSNVLQNETVPCAAFCCQPSIQGFTLSCCCVHMQVALNSPAPDPPPTLPAPILAAFASTNTTGFDNGTRLTAGTNASSSTAPPAEGAGGGGAGGAAAPGSTDATNSSSAGSDSSSSRSVLMQNEVLSLAVQPDYLVPLKVVTGISSSFITNKLQPQGRIGRELTGTEVVR